MGGSVRVTQLASERWHGGGMERGWKVLATTSIGSLMVFLDTSILNVAFRSMVKDFGPRQPATAHLGVQ